MTPMLEASERDWVELGMGTSPDTRRQWSIETTPLRRMTSPDELAGLVAFLASDEAAFMTGQAINFTGGKRMD
jgi:NAD(P)-dependent dehydrogenase (short-subunit alcohol dehydrogenase family)